MSDGSLEMSDPFVWFIAGMFVGGLVVLLGFVIQIIAEQKRNE